MSSNDEDNGGGGGSVRGGVEADDETTLDGLRFNHGAALTAPTSSIAMAMMFGSIIFATVSLASRTWLMGDMRAINTAFSPMSSPLNVKSYESLYTMLHHFSVLGLILLFAYICEYHPPFPHSEKSYDRDEFFFLTAVLFVASAYTVHRNDGKDDVALADGDDKKDDDTCSPTKAHSGAWSTAPSSVAGSASRSVMSGGGASKTSKGGGAGDGTAAGGGYDDVDDDESLDTVGTPKSGTSREDGDGSDSLPSYMPPTTHTTATGRIRTGRRGSWTVVSVCELGPWPRSCRPMMFLAETKPKSGRDGCNSSSCSIITTVPQRSTTASVS